MLTDMRGDQIVLGKPYFARTRGHRKIVMGEFLAAISRNDLSFYIHTAGYSPESFTDYVPAELPKEYDGK